MDYQEQYRLWLAHAPVSYRDELSAMEGNETALKGCFGAELAFGTAGIRGIMGLGCNRLNEFTVRRTAQGIAKWLNGTDLPKSCAIGYDSRHNSRSYAEICAVALAETGIRVHIYHELAPTPMLSYAVRELGCGCGIMVTASHNAGQYNGIKCYGEDGCQMTDEPAAVVYREIQATPYFVLPKKTFDGLKTEGLIENIPESLWNAYIDRVMQEGLNLERVRTSGLNVVYTPLCGTGRRPVQELFRRIGVKYTMVAAQAEPDGDYTTCPYPNPETDAALNESYKVANEVHPDLIVGTDPDADRTAIAVPVEGGFRKLSGNELGCVLLDYILRTRSERGDLPKDAEIVKSIVSTPLADAIAAAYDVTTKNVLTGFKYIGGEILRLEATHDEDKFIFGFEESCGYLKGTYARDKDAVVATMLVCEAAAYAKENGMNLADYADALYRTFGCYAAYVQSIELQGITAPEVSRAFMANIREHTPVEVGGCKVTATVDYLTGIRTCLKCGKQSETGLPASNVFTLELGDQGKVILRPSGTEPKIKLYYTAIGKTWDEANALMERLKAAMSAFIPK
ncbi:MAG: phospho-sugar mutase [Oscillospiraceae bacterium]|nr:phospho-sugar mutase [Oscillospiraceae bacterium]